MFLTESSGSSTGRASPDTCNQITVPPDKVFPSVRTLTKYNPPLLFTVFFLQNSINIKFSRGRGSLLEKQHYQLVPYRLFSRRKNNCFSFLYQTKTNLELIKRQTGIREKTQTWADVRKPLGNSNAGWENKIETQFGENKKKEVMKKKKKWGMFVNEVREADGGTEVRTDWQTQSRQTDGVALFSPSNSSHRLIRYLIRSELLTEVWNWFSFSSESNMWHRISGVLLGPVQPAELLTVTVRCVM